MDFPCGYDGKASAHNVGDLGLIPGLGRSPGGGMEIHVNFLAWRIPMNRGDWQDWGPPTVHGVSELVMTE